MLRFFRQIRQRLLIQNKFSKYLLYAIGEILLVVIGILIALQIDNWNDEQKLIADQEKALLNLHEEFLQNQVELDSSIRIYKETIGSNIYFFSLMGAEREELNDRNLDSLISRIFAVDEFIPSTNAVDDIIQSGRLNIINNKKLSGLLSEWLANIAIYVDRDRTLDDWTYNHTIPYMNRYVSFKQVDKYGDYMWAGESKLATSYYPLFQELEFENIIENQIFFTNVCLNRLEEIEKILDKLIELTAPNTTS